MINTIRKFTRIYLQAGFCLYLSTSQPHQINKARKRCWVHTVCEWTNMFFSRDRIVDVRYSVMLYTVFSFACIGLEEVFTVWASTEVKLGT